MKRSLAHRVMEGRSAQEAEHQTCEGARSAEPAFGLLSR